MLLLHTKIRLDEITLPLLGVEDTVHLTIEQRLTNLLFSLFSSFFVLFSPIVSRQLCLLHQVIANDSHQVRRNTSVAYI